MKKDFNKILELAKPCDLILYSNNKFNLITDGIEWFTSELGKGKKASHIDMYIGNDQCIGYTIGGCKQMKVSRYFKPEMKIYVLRRPNLTSKKKKIIIAKANLDVEHKQPYDYFSYISFFFKCILYKIGFKKIFKTDNRTEQAGWVCSTGIDRWYKAANIDLFPNVGKESVTPNHYFKAVRKGRLKEVIVI